MSYLDEHRNEIFKKYTIEELLKDIENYKNGKGKLYKTLNHFFEEEIFKCKGGRGNLTPMEALSDDAVINKIIEFTNSKPKFYKGNEISNIKSFFRNAGRTAQKVANFCPRNARDIYFRYFDINGDIINILDTSAGFGSRMSAALISGHNYCGFDPNKTLYLQLRKYLDFLRDNDIISDKQKCGLYCCGSEVFKPELVDRFDVSFTSPPYFNLETYANDDNESTKNYNNYSLWLEKFAKPTIENTYKYLKAGGYAMINIKNMSSGKKEKLFDDWLNIFKSNPNFEFIETFDISHQSKRVYNGKHATMKNEDSQYQGFKEPVMVFRKVK